MSLFDKLGGQQTQQQINQNELNALQQDYGRITSNPAQYLQAHGKTIPEGMTDPREITRYLLQTGQIGTPRLNQVMRVLGIG